MDAWHRAIAFMRTVDERAAEEVVPFRWGRALITRRLSLVYDLNFLIVDQVDGADAGALAIEAERIQREAGLSHRRVNVAQRLTIRGSARSAPANVRLNSVGDCFRQ